MTNPGLLKIKKRHSISVESVGVEHYSEFAMLRLVKLRNNQTIVVDKIELTGCKNAMIKFSDDGNLFSLY